jgi:hypothetical protein
MRDIKEALDRLRPTIQQRADILWALYISADRDTRQDLEQTIRLLDLQRNGTGPSSGPPPLPPPEPGVLAGWLRLGDVVYPNRNPTPFGLNQGELIQHVGIFGRSGAGKTNTVLCLIRSLLERDVPFLIFDWKRNYRDLLAAPWVPQGKVAAITAGRNLAPLQLNPLRPPPGTGARTWLKKVIEIMAHAYFLGEGVMYLLQQAIDACYRRSGVYEGGDQYPTFHDVHAHLKSKRVTGREANWMASTLRTLGALTFGPMADTVCAKNPTDIRELLQQNVVLELDTLTDTDKIFLVESLLLHIHHLRLTESGRETLKHVMIVEEAHHVFLRSKQDLSGGEPITDVILREIRELGEAVVLVDQHPSQIAITALGNTYCTIAMNLKHRADVNTVSDACLLELDQKDLLGRLPVGQAVVKLQDRWATPFSVTFPLVSIVKGGVSDADLDRLADTNPGNQVIPASEEHREGVPDVPVAPKEGRETPETTLSDDHIRLLKDVGDHPASGVTERYRRLELSRRKGTKLKQDLIEEGFVRDIDVPLPGGRVTLLEPTPDGYSIIGKKPTPPRSGGAVHRFWVERISATFRSRGFDVQHEASVGEGRAIDLVAEKDGNKVAVEVEVSGRRLDESLEKLRAHKAGRCVVACASNPLLDRARARLGDQHPGSDIEPVHAWSLISKPRN